MYGNKMRRLTEKDLSRIVKRVINENLSDRSDEMYSHINELIDMEYNDVDIDDQVDVLENILQSIKAKSFRNKRGLGHITHDQVRKRWSMNEDLEIAPYMIQPIKGKVKVTNQKTGKKSVYTLQTTILGFRKNLYVDSIDSKNITISVAGLSKTKEINKTNLLNLLKDSFGSKEIEYTTKDGDIIYFVLNS